MADLRHLSVPWSHPIPVPVQFPLTADTLQSTTYSGPRLHNTCRMWPGHVSFYVDRPL